MLRLQRTGYKDNEGKKQEMYKREEVLHQYGSLKAKLQYSNLKKNLRAVSGIMEIGPVKYREALYLPA